MRRADLPEHLQQLFDSWRNGPTLLGHALDEQRFYKFVKAAIAHNNDWTGEGLRELMQEAGITDPDQQRRPVARYDYCRDYERA